MRRLVEERRTPFCKLGKFVRFRPSDIDEWLDTCTVDAGVLLDEISGERADGGDDRARKRRRLWSWERSVRLIFSEPRRKQTYLMDHFEAPGMP